MLFISSKRVLALSALIAALTTLSLGTASANGAVRLVVIDEVAGPYLLRVGVLPGDPTLGPLHVSILIQDALGETAVDDATVTVAATGPGAASQAKAVNSPRVRSCTKATCTWTPSATGP